MYFVISFTMAASLYRLFYAGAHPLKLFLPGTSVLRVISIASIIVASIHFCLSALDAVTYIRKNLGALEPDPEDEIHKQLLNIMNEIKVASGAKVEIRCLVIPTVSVNALSAVDLKGNAIIAITEGLLSRVTRGQLEAVVAHEAYRRLGGMSK